MRARTVFNKFKYSLYVLLQHICCTEHTHLMNAQLSHFRFHILPFDISAMESLKLPLFNLKTHLCVLDQVSN